MAIREILKHPHPTLRKKSKVVTEFDDNLRKLVADMADTMYDAPGAGLAAPQIGVLQRVVIMDVTSKEEEGQLIVLVNPVILHGEGSQVDEEGCLSVVDFTAKVKRFEKIRVRTQNMAGEENEFEAEGWFARVIQHELDHIEGALFIDHLSSLKRALYKKQRKKQLREEMKLEKDQVNHD
ncbi:MAG: peptide deformylase [Desulfobulbaceae bacterium]|uniref:Peptide deformylase n=1 Tax=Candidatus Desulfobia pelagia TaxID=2841692 RepID=A0A8J6TC63_9BACT|nr:peptide deformylase [Candidatus Desulfobia pelagia]